MMPGLDGPELCRRVRDELGGRYIYIVLDHRRSATPTRSSKG